MYVSIDEDHSSQTTICHQVSSTNFPGIYEGYDDAWSQEKFEEVGVGF